MTKLAQVAALAGMFGLGFYFGRPAERLGKRREVAPSLAAQPPQAKRAKPVPFLKSAKLASRPPLASSVAREPVFTPDAESDLDHKFDTDLARFTNVISTCRDIEFSWHDRNVKLKADYVSPYADPSWQNPRMLELQEKLSVAEKTAHVWRADTSFPVGGEVLDLHAEMKFDDLDGGNVGLHGPCWNFQVTYQRNGGPLTYLSPRGGCGVSQVSSQQDSVVEFPTYSWRDLDDLVSELVFTNLVTEEGRVDYLPVDGNGQWAAVNLHYNPVSDETLAGEKSQSEGGRSPAGE